MSERGADLLNRLAAADERQAHAAGEVEARLNEWHAVERRLHQEALERLRILERTIEQEWRALRSMHEEPLRLLREQATALGETSVAAASLSLRGYERAEERFAALELDLRAQLTQISRDIQTVLAEVKAGGSGVPALPPPAAAPFPLERVMRIHDELRESGPAGPAASGAGSDLVRTTVEPAPPVLQVPAALSERVDLLERELSQERHDQQDTAASARRLRRDWRVAVAAVVVGAAVIGVLGWQMREALGAAAERAAAAERQAAAADREVAAARAETAAAREAARRAELVSSVLAAPDLLRFALAGVGSASAARGQVMWSRSNGFVLSASTMPPVPPGGEYQVWLLTTGGAARVGTLAVDIGGRGTLVTANPDVPLPVDGVAVTLEAVGGANTAPLGLTVLSRAPAAEP